MQCNPGVNLCLGVRGNNNNNNRGRRTNILLADYNTNTTANSLALTVIPHLNYKKRKNSHRPMARGHLWFVRMMHSMYRAWPTNEKSHFEMAEHSERRERNNKVFFCFWAIASIGRYMRGRCHVSTENEIASKYSRSVKCVRRTFQAVR